MTRLEHAAWFSAGVAACGVGVLLYSRLRVRDPHRLRAVAQAEALLNAHPTTLETDNTPMKTVVSGDADELLEEQYSRNVQFLGKERHDKFANSFVVVVGLGGVGSHAAHMLVRSGLRHIRLVDFDQVTLSSLNRHAVAGRSDVGSPKAQVLANHLRRFAPDCKIEVCVAMFEASAAKELLAGNPDYVVDAIDDLKTKMDLLEYCATHKLPVLSSMSAGARSDPTRLHIGRLTDVTYDPMASRLRWLIKKRKINPENVFVLYSSEKPVVKLLPLEDEQAEDPGAFGAVPHFRLRVIPVIGMLPAIFGMTMSTFVCLSLAGVPFNPMPVPTLSQAAVHKFHQKLVTRDRKVHKSGKGEILASEDDLAYLITLFRQRCAITGKRMGTQGMRSVLTRWRFDQPCDIYNLVLVHDPIAAKLDALAMSGELPTPEALETTQEVFDNVVNILEKVKQYCKVR